MGKLTILRERLTSAALVARWNARTSSDPTLRATYIEQKRGGGNATRMRRCNKHQDGRHDLLLVCFASGAQKLYNVCGECGAVVDYANLRLPA